MRVQCKVLDAPTNAVAGHRPGKGAISLGTINTPGLRTSIPCMSVFTATGKEEKYPLNGTSEVKMIHDKFIPQGKVTIIWAKPARTTFVSEAKADVLKNFVQILRAVLKGENMDSLKQIAKEKKSDLGGQVELIVRDRKDYPPKSYSSATLKTLVISGIGLKIVDGKWFSCTQLTTLDLSKNLLSCAPNLNKMNLMVKLVNLQVLNLSRNGFVSLPIDMMSSLPPSLLSLDLSFNKLRLVPSLSHLPLLSLLNMSNNELERLPSELRIRPSLSLNLDNNCIKFIPLMRSSSRQTFSISGNPLNEAVTTPNLDNWKCPSLLQLAMQSIKRNRLKIEGMYMSRFWDYAGVNHCDYCRGYSAADQLLLFIHGVAASSISQQAAFNTTYPTLIAACRRCYKNRHTDNQNQNQNQNPIRNQNQNIRRRRRLP